MSEWCMFFRYTWNKIEVNQLCIKYDGYDHCLPCQCRAHFLSMFPDSTAQPAHDIGQHNTFN